MGISRYYGYRKLLLDVICRIPKRSRLNVRHRRTIVNIRHEVARIRRRKDIMSKGNDTESKNQGWFHIESNGRGYYTPFFTSRSEKCFAGPGDRPATPEEIVNKLDELGEDAYVSECGNYIINPGVKTKSGKDGELPPGFYDYKAGGGGTPERLIPKEIRNDKFTKTDMYLKVVSFVNNFLNEESHYRPGLHKTGILLYGPPGTGKTSCIRTLIKEQIPKDSIVIFTNSIASNEFLKIMKLTLSDRLKVFVFEEMMTVVDESRSIERVLDFLDGEISLDKSLCLATTNYPERLPANVVDRHGRIDELYFFENPKGKDLKAIINQYLGRECTKQEFEACEGLPSASVQQACIRSKRGKESIGEIVKGFKARSSLVSKDFSKAKDIGIKSTYSDFYDSDDD